MYLNQTKSAVTFRDVLYYSVLLINNYSNDISSHLFQHLLTYLLTPWSRALLEKLNGSQLFKKFLAFYGTLRFITTLQVPATCPYPDPDRSIPCPTSHFLKIHLNNILPSMPGPSKWSLLQVSPLRPSTHLSSPHTCYIPQPSRSFRFF